MTLNNNGRNEFGAGAEKRRSLNHPKTKE